MLDYTPTQITKLVHSIPHLSFKFKLLSNPEFTFDDAEYLESLAVVALMPVAILLITMISFLIYYCCVEMKRSANKTSSAACYCSVCLMLTFIMLALGGIGFACYGSIQCHDGMESASSAVVEINKSFSAITVQVDDIQALNVEFSNQVEQLTEMYPNDTSIKAINDTAHMMYDAVQNLPEQTFGANDRLEWTIEIMKEAEQYRTIVTFSLIGLQGLVCMLGLAGVCFRSKCLLITATFIGLICLVASYLYAGINLMTDVGVSDLCMDPYDYIVSQAVSKLYMNNVTAQYYLRCLQDLAPSDGFSPVVTSLKSGYDEIYVLLAEAEVNLGASSKGVLDNITTTNNELVQLAKTLKHQITCEEVANSLQEFVESICGPTVEGIFFLCAALIATCLSLTAVLCAAPKTWKRYTKRQRNGDNDMDLDDVFLPPSNNSRAPISRTNNPLYISSDDRGSRRMSSNQSASNLPAATNTLSFFRHSEENMTLLDSPPPYSPRRGRATRNED